MGQQHMQQHNAGDKPAFTVELLNFSSSGLLLDTYGNTVPVATLRINCIKPGGIAEYIIYIIV
jgi:hypothetical protein